MEWAEIGYGILLLLAFTLGAFVIDIFIKDVPDKKERDKN